MYSHWLFFYSMSFCVTSRPKLKEIGFLVLFTIPTKNTHLLIDFFELWYYKSFYQFLKCHQYIHNCGENPNNVKKEKKIVKFIFRFVFLLYFVKLVFFVALSASTVTKRERALSISLLSESSSGTDHFCVLNSV